MDKINYNPWIIYFDLEKNRNIYKKINQSGPESCGCEPCLNFIAARKYIYPDAAIEILSKLGIDYKKEQEIYHYAKIAAKRHSYGGRFVFVGKLEYLDKNYISPESGAEVLKFIKLSDNFSWRFSHKIDIVPEVFKGYPLVQIDFVAQVPWLVKYKEPE